MRCSGPCRAYSSIRDDHVYNSGPADRTCHQMQCNLFLLEALGLTDSASPHLGRQCNLKMALSFLTHSSAVLRAGCLYVWHFAESADVQTA